MAEQLTSILHIAEGLICGRIATLPGNGDKEPQVYSAFEGIPYAEPPLRELRFKDPKPPKCWTGIFKATELRNVSDSTEEDCLYLNIYTPDLKSTRGVLVLLSDVPQTIKPESFLQYGIVVVTITFRTGILGFLSLPSQQVPGNAGLKDIVTALNWIHTNIGKFGGDRNNVTVLGLGVEAPCYAHLLTMSPLTDGLFTKLILLSGSALVPYREYSSNVGLLEEKLGCVGEEEIFRKLVGLSNEKLGQLFTGEQCSNFPPVVEKSIKNGAFLLANPIELLKNGHFTPVPTIFGLCFNETELAQKFGHDIAATTSNFELFVPPEFKLRQGTRLRREVGKQIKQFYYGDENPSEDLLEPYNQLVTDVKVFLGIAETIKQLRKKQTKVWFVGTDGGYLIKGEVLRAELMPYLINFVKTGEAGEANSVKWCPITKKDQNYLEVTCDDGVRAKTNFGKQTLDFWNELKLNIEKQNKI